MIFTETHIMFYVYLTIGMNILCHMLLHNRNIMNLKQRRMDIIGRKIGAQQL